MPNEKKVRVTSPEDIDATPEAVELAEEGGVDITEIQGTGKDGRILVGDVQAEIDKRAEASDKSGVVTSADVNPPGPDEPENVRSDMGDMPEPNAPDVDDEEAAAMARQAEVEAEADGEEGERYGVRLATGKLPYPGIATQYETEDGEIKTVRITTRAVSFLTRPQIRAIANALKNQYGVANPKDALEISEVPKVTSKRQAPVSSAQVSGTGTVVRGG